MITPLVSREAKDVPLTVSVPSPPAPIVSVVRDTLPELTVKVLFCAHSVAVAAAFPV